MKIQQVWRNYVKEMERKNKIDKKIYQETLLEVSKDPKRGPKVYIFDNELESKVVKYFSSCNESRRVHIKNAKSELGAKYFTRSSLESQEWYDEYFVDNLATANVVLIPFQFTLALTGRCGIGTEAKYGMPKDNSELLEIFTSLMNTLLEKKDSLRRKAIFIVMFKWSWRWYEYESGLINETLTKLRQSEVFVFIGHFEVKIQKNRAPWELKDDFLEKDLDQTVVLPYTIPFDSNTYGAYNDLDIDALYDDFQRRSHSVFYMGSASSRPDACQKGIKFFYKNRLRSMILMSHANLKDLNPFGIVLLHEECEKLSSDVQKFTNFPEFCSPQKEKKSGASKLPLFPCFMTYNMSKQLNKKNSLYFHGLENSKFNLMIEGGTMTSAKYYDSIAFNMINIFVGIEEERINQYLPYSDVIPYKKFSFFIKPGDYFKSGRERGRNIRDIVINTPEQQIKDMLSNLSFYKSHILYNMKGSRAVQNTFDQVFKKWKHAMCRLKAMNECDRFEIG